MIFADDVSRSAGFGGINPDNSLYLAAEGAGEGMQGLYDTVGLTAGFFASEGQGELTLTAGFGPAVRVTLARDEVGGDLRLVDLASGAGAGVAADFSLDVTDNSSDYAGFSQTVSFSMPMGNTGVGYTATFAGYENGDFNSSGVFEVGLSTQGVSPYVALEAASTSNFVTGDSQTVINPGVGVKTGVSGGAGGFFIIDWDVFDGSKETNDPVVGKNPKCN